jgi:putative protease
MLLSYENEIPEVIELLNDVLPLKPDALIVQDIGLCTLVRSLAPSQVIHGSTQMTITNHEAMSFLSDLEIKRFVLGREVSLTEIKQIKEKTDCELEVFVHGALCVAYSGQCFTSESIGGRSANRGQCAQSCRLEYDMIVDGKKVDMKERKYLVSPKDLCGIAEIPELVSLGVASFKVEGRLKTPEYVASAAKNYRRAIDFAHKKPLDDYQVHEAQKEMSLTYSRGFFSGWLHGVDHQHLVDGSFGAHRGLKIGKVLKVVGNKVQIESSLDHLKNGDGLLIAGFHHKKIESGGKIYQIQKLSQKNCYEISFDKSFDLKKIHIGFDVFYNHDAVVEKKLKQSYQDKDHKKRIPVSIHVKALVNQPLEVSITCVDSFQETHFRVYSQESVEAAIKNPTTLEDLFSELGALGNTCFKINKKEDISLDAPEEFFIHQKVLKNIRREFTEKLMKSRIEGIQSIELKQVDLETIKKPSISLPNVLKNQSKLNILLRDMNQVLEVISFKSKWESLHLFDSIGCVILDFEFGKGYTESIEKLKNAGFKAGIATTRILKPNEYYNLKIILKAMPDFILCRNLGSIQYFQQHSPQTILLGDFSLNVTNSLTAKYLTNKNIHSLCASYDLSSKQIFDLIQHSQAEKIEVNIHQYMPSFHMEHCVFAAFMSKGSSFKDCGKPCEKHQLELVDQFGNHHQIRADQECRNTMFNAIAQSAAKMIPKLKDSGVVSFRFEALYEKGDDLYRKITSYLTLIHSTDHNSVNEIISQIGVLEKYGLSDGAQRERDYQDRKK